MMYLLPRGKIIKEHLDTARLKMPDALLKMCSNQFSGYLLFDYSSFAAILCYAHGKIIAALWQTAQRRLCGEAALEMMFRALQGNDKCSMGVYRLEDDFLSYIQQFCNAKAQLINQSVDLLDIERLIKRLKQDKVSGCLRVHSSKGVVLIFYLDGIAHGFFCDGNIGLTTDVDISTSIAKDDDCLLDLLINDPSSGNGSRLDGVNLEKIWLQVWRELNP